MPRSVLECSSREQIFPEGDFCLLSKRLHSIEAETQNLAISLEQREEDCAALRRQVKDLQASHSWKVTAPLRAVVDFFRLEGK